MPRESSINDFGLIIAYVLPGFTALAGAAYLTGRLEFWFATESADAPTVAGFLYLTLASVAAGLTVSTLRWLVIDAVHHRTGVRPPPWDFAQLRSQEAALAFLVEGHYRYYQFYGNMLVSLALVLTARRLASGWLKYPDGMDVALLLLEVVFFLGSRDTLRKYYVRTGQLLRKKKHAEPG